MTGFLSQNWNGSSWLNVGQNLYTYTDFKKIMTYLMQNWTNGKWENYIQYLYSYDTSENLIKDIEQQWKGTYWLSTFQRIYDYDSRNNQTILLEQYIRDGIWGDFDRFLYGYDENNNPTSYIIQDWNDSTWMDLGYLYQKFDDNNFKLYESSRTWEGDTYYGDSVVYYFHSLPTGFTELRKENISVYPNPGNGILRIKITDNIENVVIYNLIGDKVYNDFEFSNQSSTEINVSNFPKGIYIFKVHSGKKNYTQKIMIQ
jgi:hypothetical protein